MTRKTTTMCNLNSKTLILNITFIFAKQHPILSTPPSFLHWHQICVTLWLGFPPHVCFRFLFLWCYISMLRSDSACKSSALFKCAWSHFKSDQASCVKYPNQSYFWLVKNFKGRFSLFTGSKWTYFCASWQNFYRSLVWAWLHPPIFSAHLQHLSELR